MLSGRREEGCLDRDAESDGSISSSSPYGGPTSLQLSDPAEPALRLPPLDAVERTDLADVLPPEPVRDRSGRTITLSEPDTMVYVCLVALCVSGCFDGESNRGARQSAPSNLNAEGLDVPYRCGITFAESSEETGQTLTASVCRWRAQLCCTNSTLSVKV